MTVPSISHFNYSIYRVVWGGIFSDQPVSVWKALRGTVPKPSDALLQLHKQRRVRRRVLPSWSVLYQIRPLFALCYCTAHGKC